jgi:hypothetical protein
MSEQHQIDILKRLLVETREKLDAAEARATAAEQERDKAKKAQIQNATLAVLMSERLAAVEQERDKAERGDAFIEERDVWRTAAEEQRQRAEAAEATLAALVDQPRAEEPR